MRDASGRYPAHNPEGLPERTIREAKVYEFGPVTFPADPGADYAVRAAAEDREPGRRRGDLVPDDSGEKIALRPGGALPGLVGEADHPPVGRGPAPLRLDVTEDELAGILLDMATLALRLDKQLTARLMPVPGLKAGDVTGFDFAYFANGQVLGVKGMGSPGLFARAS